MEPKTAKALTAYLEEVRKAPDARDEKRMKECETVLAEALKAAGTDGASEGMKDLVKELAQIKADLAAQAEAVRKYQKAGLLVRGGSVTVPGREARLQMLADGRAFVDDEQARRFGGWIMERCFTARRMDVPKAVREIADDVRKAVGDMDVSVGASGEYLIPDEFRAELIRNVEATALVFPLFRRVPLVTGGQTILPKRTGGITAYPVAAAAEFERQRMTLDTVTLQPAKWGAICVAPNEFVRSSLLVDLGNFVALELVYALREAMDNACVNGDGTGAYAGITGLLRSGTLSTVTFAAHTTGATMTEVDADAIVEGITNAYALPNARWLLSLSMLLRLKHLRSATGEPLLWDKGDVASGLPSTIDGFPYTISPKFPAKASVTAATVFSAFGDPRMSHIVGMLRDIQIDASDQAFWTSDQIGFRGLVVWDFKEADADAMVLGKTHA